MNSSYVVFVAACMVASAFACASSNTDLVVPDGGYPPQDDAAPPTKDGSSTKRRDASFVDATTLLACREDDVKLFPWIGPSGAHQGRCTNAQIAKLVSDCIDPGTKTQAKCDAYRTSSDYDKDCDRCLTGSGQGDDSVTTKELGVPVVLPVTIDGSAYGRLNTEACAAAALGIGVQCGNAVTQITACQFSCCAPFPLEELDGCLARETTGVCKPRSDAVRTSCLDPIEAGKAIWEPLCTGGNSAFKDALPVMAAYMCGSAP